MAEFRFFYKEDNRIKMSRTIGDSEDRSNRKFPLDRPQ